MSVPIREALEFPILLQIEDGDTTLFPQVVLRDEVDANVGGSPIDLTHLTEGLYRPGTIIIMPAIVQWVSATYIVYTDAGHTIESEEHFRAQEVFVRDIPTDYDHRFLDTTVYNINGLLTSARERFFLTAAAALAATDGGSGEGEIATVNHAATAGGTPGQPDTYTRTKA